MRCFIKHKAYQKMRYYIKNIDAEISGWGKTEIIDGDIYVLDLVIFDQTVTGSSTDLDHDARAKFGMELKKAGEKQENWNLWWHSHVNMNVFWSPTDDTAIKNEIGKIPFLLSIVGNKKKELLTRLDFTMTSNSPLDAGFIQKTIDKIETKIMPVDTTRENVDKYNNLKAEIDAVYEETKSLEAYLADKKKELDEKEFALEQFLDDVSEDEEVEKECIKDIKSKVKEKGAVQTSFFKKPNKWTGRENGYVKPTYSYNDDDYDYNGGSLLNIKTIFPDQTLDEYIEKQYPSDDYADEQVINDDFKYKLELLGQEVSVK